MRVASRMVHLRTMVLWMGLLVAVLAPTTVLVASAVRWEFGRTVYWVLQLDWFLAQNDALSSWSPTLWFNVTLLGEVAVLLAALSPLALLAPQCWASLVATVPIAGATSVALKGLAATPRPAHVIDPAEFTVIGDCLTGINSLPSGHSITAFAAAGAIISTYYAAQTGQRQLWPLVPIALAGAGAIGMSRVAVGAHWPIDVVAGAAFGWLAGLAGSAVVRWSPGWVRCLDSITSRHVHAATMLVISLAVCFRALDGAAAYFPASLWIAMLSGLCTCVCLSNGWVPKVGRTERPC